MQRKHLLSIPVLGFLLLLLSSCFDSPVGSDIPTLVNDTIVNGLTMISDTSQMESKDTIRIIPPVKPDTIKVRIPLDPSDPLGPEPPPADTIVTLHQTMIVADSAIYEFVQVFPEYPGGMSALDNEIFKHLSYPEMCQEMGIEGTLYLSFVVEKDGTLSNFQILRGIKDCPQMDKEAVRVFKKLTHVFTPGIMNNVPVRTRMKWPIKIRFQ